MAPAWGGYGGGNGMIFDASIYGAAACVVIAIMAAACWLAMVVMDSKTARGTGGNDADTPLTITAQGGDHG